MKIDPVRIFASAIVDKPSRIITVTDAPAPPRAGTTISFAIIWCQRLFGVDLDVTKQLMDARHKARIDGL